MRTVFDLLELGVSVSNYSGGILKIVGKFTNAEKELYDFSYNGVVHTYTRKQLEREFEREHMLLHNPNFKMEGSSVGRRAILCRVAPDMNLNFITLTDISKNSVWVFEGVFEYDHKGHYNSYIGNNIFGWEDELFPDSLNVPNSNNNSRLEQIKEILYDHYAVLSEKRLDKPALMQYHEEYKALTGREYLKF